jgi:hypothetical protein
VAVWCVFPSWENEDGGAEVVGSGGVGACDGVFHGAAHACVVVFRVSDVSVVPSVWCIISAR